MEYQASDLSSENYLITKSEELKNEGNHAAAIELCEKALFDELDNAEAYEELGDNFLSLREYDKAEKALIQALRLNPQSPNAHYLIGFTYSAIGNWQESISHLEQADFLQSNHPEILRCLGWSIFHGGDRVKGIVLLERALNLNPKDPLILSDLGVCHLNQKNFERAKTVFNEVLRMEPDNIKVIECLRAIDFFKEEFAKLRNNKKS